jgi:hypothetical protein
MTDLSPDSKELFRHARTALSPPDVRLEAVRAALKAQIAATSIPPANPAAPTSGPASGIASRALARPVLGAAGWGGGHTLATAALIGVLGGGAAWFAVVRSNSMPPPAPIAVAQGEPVGRPPASREAPAALEADPASNAPLSDSTVTSIPSPSQAPDDVRTSAKLSAASREPARAASRPRAKSEITRETVEAAPAPAPPAAAAPAAAPPAPSDSLAEEVSMLRAARAALDRGDATHALRVLDAHEARFQRATLYEERLATRVLALCALGRIDAARSAAQELERVAPRSPHLPRVRASCIAQLSGK